MIAARERRAELQYQPVKMKNDKQSVETAALNDLLTTMNNPAITGAEVPVGVDTRVPDIRAGLKSAPTPPEAVQKAAAPPPPETAAPEPETRVFSSRRMPTYEEAKTAVAGISPPTANHEGAEEATFSPAATRIQKLCFTGRLGAGKDHVAAASGATIFGFADPLYAVASYYFGTDITSTKNKELPGVREFLQTIGQWGRAVVNEKYPLTIQRALMVKQVRSDGITGGFGFFQVDWDSFGKNPDIWLNACIERANIFLEKNPDGRVAITNVRFSNEFQRLAAEGFSHWHIMCGLRSWTARLAKSGLTPDSPAVKDTSEQLAAKLDASVIKQTSEIKQGPKLRAIWSDEAAPPSGRLHTVESFLKSIG